jgi:hypothetical protein
MQAEQGQCPYKGGTKTQIQQTNKQYKYVKTENQNTTKTINMSTLG